VSRLEHIGRAALYRGHEPFFLRNKYRRDQGFAAHPSYPSLCSSCDLLTPRRSPAATGRYSWYQIHLSSATSVPLVLTDPNPGQIRYFGDLDLLRHGSLRSRRPRPAYRLPVGVGHRKSTVSHPAPSTTNFSRAA